MSGAGAHTLVLVSQSPRRRQLLAERGFRLEVVEPPADVAELSDGEPRYVVAENARRKVAAHVERLPGDGTTRLKKVFLGVDTIVEHAGHILGKPADPDDARRMLGMLSGKVHRVYSAIHLMGADDGAAATVCETRVRFGRLSTEDIDWYVATGEPLDKAGAYGIQGFAGCFVEAIDGCYYNVVGLPLAALCAALGTLGLATADVLVGPPVPGRGGKVT